MLLGTLGSKLLGNLLAGKVVIRGGEGMIKAKATATSCRGGQDF